MQTWKIGDVRITRLVEIEGETPGTFLFPDATPPNVARHAAKLAPRFATDTGRLVTSIHAFVIESQGRRIVVDTCVGNDKSRKLPAWNGLQLPFLADLAAAGFPRESIDRVICTHLHVDHVGWNTMLVNGKWVPTFPNARYLLGRIEWDHWSRVGDDDFGPVLDDSVRPVIEAGLVDLVEPDARVTDEIVLEPTPGHTPGHVSVHVTSKGEEAVITGDLMHHPVQCLEPSWGSHFDSDGKRAERTRRAFLERYADRPVLILGTHFATPAAGRIVRDGDVWRFDAEA